MLGAIVFLLLASCMRLDPSPLDNSRNLGVNFLSVLLARAGNTTATRVHGQPDLTSNAANNGGISANSLNLPKGLAVDSAGNLYVADGLNTRVLFFAPGSTTATRVYGQSGSFTTNVTGTTATRLKGITYWIALDSGGNLYIADSGNNRVLYFVSGSTTATQVYGQAGSFVTGTANNGGISANSMSEPIGLAVDSAGNVYLADFLNSRALYYPSGSTTATQVFGQAGNFTTATINNGGISANSLNFPYGAAVDSSGNLYIADTTNNRVLYYPAGSTTATRVYGQPDFTTNTANNGGVSANSLKGGSGLAVDSGGNLYIADGGNNRVLYYPAGSTTATRVYGQPDFTSNTANNVGISANSLNGPNGVALNGAGNVYISDTQNNRVLYYGP
ncbi:MAG: NHL repeat-containing protein [Spirochaetia bacterium]|nr:NHL repeat-containing protein [Spirochaetia bacterium]